MRETPAARRSTLRRPTATTIACGVLLALLAARLYRGPSTPPLEQPGEYFVQRVVDGDTLLLRNGRRLRLIGVDTPETKHPDRPAEPYGPEASAFTRQLAEGRVVRIEFDRARVDRYGRTLAYVFIGETLLNEELIRRGYSRAETRFPFRSDMQRRFRDAEDEARAAGRGLWRADAGRE